MVTFPKPRFISTNISIIPFLCHVSKLHISITHMVTSGRSNIPRVAKSINQKRQSNHLMVHVSTYTERQMMLQNMHIVLHTFDNGLFCKIPEIFEAHRLGIGTLP